MSTQLWRKILAAPVLVAAIVILFFNLWSYLPVQPFHYSDQVATGTIDYRITDMLIAVGECSELTWKTEGIQSIYLSVVGVNGGVIGNDTRTFCADGALASFALTFTVNFQNGEQRSYSTEIRVLATNRVFPEIGIFWVGLALLMAPLPKPNLRAFIRLLPITLIPLGFAAAFLLLLLLDKILSAPFMVHYVTHAMYDSLATDPDRCGFDHFNLDAAPFSIQPERILFQDIPALPHHEGRIIIVGLSNSSESILWPELSPALQQRFLNLSVGAASALEHGTVLDYLQNEKGTLTPTNGKSAVVLLYWNGAFALNPPHAGWQKAFTEYQQLKLDVVSPNEWKLTPINDPFSIFSLANARLSAMIFEHLPRAIRATIRPDAAFVGTQAATCYPALTQEQLYNEAKSFWDYYYGPPETYMLPNAQTKSFDMMVERIQKTGTPVVIVNLPISSWFQTMVFQERYLKYIKTFSEEHHVPVYDLSELVPDKDFRDNIHLTITGRRQLQARLFEILVQEGILSEADIQQ
jgi:hypothetical protein